MKPTLCFLLLGGMAACGDDQQPEEAAALLTRIRAESYRDWERAPGYEVRRQADSPHSDEVDIYINPTVSLALQAGPLPAWPRGSLIVKDGFDGDELELIAVMEKREDGWFWAEYFDDDSKYSGKPGVCIDCHEDGDDFVLAFELPK
ncbi:MAG: hypothetical protein SFX73_07225 [Kofleriaceae bacterium]|nr:hypothetical protein [Kofleriaceae bacterium]